MNSIHFVYLTIIALAVKIVFSGIVLSAGNVGLIDQVWVPSLFASFLAIAAGVGLLVRPFHPFSISASAAFQLGLVFISFPYTLNQVV